MEEDSKVNLKMIRKKDLEQKKYFNGDNYIGEFKNDLSEGYGIYYFYNYRAIYEGEFKNNKKNGYGIEYYSDGSKYKGKFKNGKMEGYVFCFYSDGSKFIGEFKDGLKEGF